MNDALKITLLGFAMLAVGMSLIHLVIHSFSLLSGAGHFFTRSKNRMDATVAAPPPPAPAAVTHTPPPGPVDTEILAVITAVLEIELRLRASLIEGKFTFNK